MKKLILVPMKRDDRAEDLLPYVEEVARPGMKVVFMLPYPVDGFRYSTEESGLRAIEEGKRLAAYCDWQANREKAEARIAPAANALATKGIEAVADIRAGRVTNAVRDCAAEGEIHLIVARAGIWQKIAGLLTGNNSLRDLFKRPSFSPVLLSHPSTVG